MFAGETPVLHARSLLSIPPPPLSVFTLVEVGVSQMPARGSLNFLTPSETRTHFSAWCIVSSPLTLSHDLTNTSTMDAVWTIITNREALAVNDAWAGTYAPPTLPLRFSLLARLSLGPHA